MSVFFNRRNKIRRELQFSHLDALWITHPFNIRYLTGFTGGDTTLIIFENGDDILVSDGRYTLQIEEECPDLKADIRPNIIQMADRVADLVCANKAKQVGVEAESVTCSQYDKFRTKLSCCEVIPTTHLVETLRQIKDRSEIAAIRKSIDLAHRAFQDVQTCLNSKMTEKDIRNELDYRMMKLGAEKSSFATIVGAGPRAALPHCVPSNACIDGHSHVLFDWGAIVDGYCSDITRVLVFAPKNKKLRTVYEAVLNAQESAIEAIKPDKTGEEIDAIARKSLQKAGLLKHFNHGLGHSFGLEIHESPRLAANQKTKLRPGMILTVEPGVYLKNWGGIRIEDDILVTKTGCEVLSKDVPKSYDDILR
ncbi:MAG: M24 family metallopeptidase [Thermoguttaceae bacterium]